MGSACCVAARDRTITDQSVNDVMTRNDRYSPSWSFRWDNRGRVAGEEEESSMACFSDGAHMNDRLDNKSHTTIETTYATEEGSPLESSRSLMWQKSSSPSEENGVPQSDPLTSKNISEGKEPRETPTTSQLSPTKISISTPTHSTISSFSASPLSSSQSHLLPLTSLTPSRWPRHSPRHHHLLRQVSPNFSISEDGSPFMHHRPKSNRGSYGGSSSENWFPELTAAAASNRDHRWSFDSGSMSFHRRSSGRVSSGASPSIDKNCGVCSRILTERSRWSVAANGFPVAAVLICGHVYHAECLENMTPEINKYDPACPVCTFGEKKVLKLCEKAAVVDGGDLKAKFSKKLRGRVVDGGGDSVLFRSGSSGVKNSSGNGKPFLKRHFSFGNKWNRSLSDNSSRKKRFFWSKSSKE